MDISYNRYRKFSGDELASSAGAWDELAKLAGDGLGSQDYTQEYLRGDFASGANGVTPDLRDVDTYSVSDAVEEPVRVIRVKRGEGGDPVVSMDDAPGRKIGATDTAVVGNEEDLVDSLNADLDARNLGARIDLDARDDAKAAEIAAEVREKMQAEEQERGLEGRLVKLRERLGEYPSFVTRAREAMQTAFERPMERLREIGRKVAGLKPMTDGGEAETKAEVETEVVEDDEGKTLEERTRELVVDPEGQVEAVAEKVLAEPEMVRGQSERELAAQYEFEQKQRQDNLKKLGNQKAQLEERMWKLHDSAMQERFAQAADLLDKKILGIEAAMLKAAQLEAERRRPLTEMEAHGQFALTYLEQNGIFEGKHDRAGLEELKKLKHNLDMKVLVAVLDDREIPSAEYMEQLEYVRPAVRELERLLDHGEDWQDMRMPRDGLSAA